MTDSSGAEASALPEDAATFVSLTGATTTDPMPMVFSIQHNHPQGGAACEHHGHAHHHGHDAHLAAAGRPTISLNVPAAQLVAQYQEDPQQLFQILLYVVKMGSFELFQDILGNIETTKAERKDDTLITSSLLRLRDPHGHSLLHWAAKRSDQVQFIQYLVAKLLLLQQPEDDKSQVLKLADLVDDETGMTPLHWACTEPNNLVVLQHLLSTSTTAAAPSNNGASTVSLLELKDGTGCTPLLIAAQQGLVETCALLLQRGANRHAMDVSRDTALHWAAYKGSLSVVGLLCYYDEPSNSINGNGGSDSLTTAASASSMMLCQADAYGQTPLHLAALRGHASVCRYMVQRVAGMSTVSASMSRRRRQAARDLLLLADKNGRTPLELAKHKEQHAVAAVLQRQMDWLGVALPTSNKQQRGGSNKDSDAENNSKARRQHFQATLQRTCKNLLRWKAWSTWLGIAGSATSGNNADQKLLDASDSLLDEAPRFPFYYVKAHFPANFLFYFWFLCPVLSPGDGVLWDVMGLQVIMILLFASAGYSLWKTNTTDPGRLTESRVSTSVAGNNKNTTSPSHELQYWRRGYEQTLDSYATASPTTTMASSTPNLCHTCHVAKPPRSKHDRYTDACILMFDHHCPFVGNTVGLYNYKWFYLFLLSMTLYFTSLLFMLALYCHRLPQLPLMAMSIGLFLGLHVLVTGGMLIYHTQLTVMNLTTNEHLNLQRYEYFWEASDHGRRRFHNPWNKGWMTNFWDRWDPSERCYTLPGLQESSLAIEMKSLLGDQDRSNRPGPTFDSHNVV